MSTEPKDELAEDVLFRFDELVEDRLEWEPNWKNIIKFLNLSRYNFDRTQKKGQKLGAEVFNGQPITALNLFKNGVYGYSFNPTGKWFGFEINDPPGLDDIPEVRSWLDAVEDIFRKVFLRSNFYSAVSPFIRDGGAMGTAYMWIEDNVYGDNIIYKVLHTGECYIDQNANGVIDTKFRNFELTARSAVEYFGEDNVSKKLLESAKKSGSDRFEFVHGVFPNTDRNIELPDNLNMKWASVYVEVGEGQTIKTGGFSSFPAATWRFEQGSDEVYGRGPGHYSIIDVATLNLISKDLQRASQMAVQPSMNVHIEQKGQERFGPRGLNYFSNRENAAHPVNTGVNYPVGFEYREELQAIINQHWHVPLFLMLQQAEREMTATEILERMGEKVAVLSPILSGLYDDAVDKVFDRTWEILLAKRKIPRPPQEVIQFGGTIKVIKLGPLAMAQKRLWEGGSIQKALIDSTTLIQLKPEVLDKINGDDSLIRIFRSHGVPQSTIVPDETVAAIRKQRAELERAAQQAEIAKTGTEAIRNASQANAASEGALTEGIAEGAQEFLQ